MGAKILFCVLHDPVIDKIWPNTCSIVMTRSCSTQNSDKIWPDTCSIVEFQGYYNITLMQYKIFINDCNKIPQKCVIPEAVLTKKCIIFYFISSAFCQQTS